MKKLSLLLCLLAAACSSSSPTDPGPIDAQLTLAAGQSAPVGTSTTAIRFVGVTSDSRCPAAAICVSAGDAVARFEVGNARGAAPVDLHTTLDPKRAETGGLAVQLLELSPYPITFHDIQPSEYRATIRVTR